LTSEKIVQQQRTSYKPRTTQQKRLETFDESF